jgi:hypothetical protein
MFIYRLIVGVCGEVAYDPSGPSLAAEQLGREIFSRKYSDYRLDTESGFESFPLQEE